MRAEKLTHLHNSVRKMLLRRSISLENRTVWEFVQLYMLHVMYVT